MPKAPTNLWYELQLQVFKTRKDNWIEITWLDGSLEGSRHSVSTHACSLQPSSRETANVREDQSIIPRHQSLRSCRHLSVDKSLVRDIFKQGTTMLMLS